MRARIRMSCLLIYGVSGVGKLMLLKNFERDHAPKRANRNGQRHIIATQMPQVPVVRSRYDEIARTLAGNVRSTPRFYELEHTTITLLTHARPRPAFHRVYSCSYRWSNRTHNRLVSTRRRRCAWTQSRSRSESISHSLPAQNVPTIINQRGESRN